MEVGSAEECVARPHAVEVGEEHVLTRLRPRRKTQDLKTQDKEVDLTTISSAFQCLSAFSVQRSNSFTILIDRGPNMDA